MKSKVFVFFIAVTAISCTAEKNNNKSDLELANLKGKVLKIERIVHNANAKSVCPAAEKVSSNQSIYEYSDKGNLIESSDIDMCGNVSLNCKYVYSKHDVCTEVLKYSGDKLVGKDIYVIEGSRLTEIRSFDEYGVNDKIFRYIYSGDQLTDEETTNSSGEIMSSVHNEYVNGSLNSRTKKDSQGNISSVIKYERNSQNDIILYTVNVPKDNMEYKFVLEYEYDSQGNWIKQTQFYNGEIENIVVRNITYATT